MIPICLVTGFLGSGKTTLLRELTGRLAGRRVVYLVNEFSEADVDGALLAGSAETVTVSGGSIFCRCKASDFIGRLGEIVERFHTAADPLAGVVIEASGMADPRVADRLLAETGMGDRYRLAAVVCIVDPGTFGKLVHTLPAVHHQVAAADVVLLNKSDLHAEPVLSDCEAEVRKIAPDADIRRTRFCRADFDVFAPHSHAREGEMAACRDPNFQTVAVELKRNVDWPALDAALAGLGDDLYRAKGFVPTEQGMRYLDRTAGGGSSLSPAPPAAPGRLVLIVRGQSPQRAEALAADIADGRFYSKPTNGGGR